MRFASPVLLAALAVCSPGFGARFLLRRRSLLCQRDGRLRRGLPRQRQAGRHLRHFQGAWHQSGPHPAVEQRDLDQIQQSRGRRAQHQTRQGAGPQGAARFPLFGRLGGCAASRSFPPPGRHQGRRGTGADAVSIHLRHADGAGPRRADAGHGAGRQRDQFGNPDAGAVAKGQTINWARNAKLLNAAIKAVRDAGANRPSIPR